MPRPSFLDEYEGRWVAVKDGAVITAAATSRALAVQVLALPSAFHDAVIQYVFPPTNAYRVGVG